MSESIVIQASLPVERLRAEIESIRIVRIRIENIPEGIVLIGFYNIPICISRCYDIPCSVIVVVTAFSVNVGEEKPSHSACRLDSSPNIFPPGIHLHGLRTAL